MPIRIINNIFSKDEIDRIYESVSNNESVVDTKLGRIQYNQIIDAIDDTTSNKLHDIVMRITNTNLKMGGVVYVEYNNLYGTPNLPPHVDADSTDILMNIQLESNTVWELGLNLKTYSLKDNSGLLFNPNENIHWRVHKKFLDGEYVKMLFIRFYNSANFSNNSHLPNNENHDMFKEAREFRDSLRDRTVF
jgi:hypothetical protein